MFFYFWWYMCNNLSFFLPLLSSLLKIFAKIVYMLQISTICPVLMVTGCRDSHQCSDNTSQHSIGNSLGMKYYLVSAFRLSHLTVHSSTLMVVCQINMNTGSILTYQTNQSRIRRVESSIGHSSGKFSDSSRYYVFVFNFLKVCSVFADM